MAVPPGKTLPGAALSGVMAKPATYETVVVTVFEVAVYLVGFSGSSLYVELALLVITVPPGVVCAKVALASVARAITTISNLPPKIVLLFIYAPD